MPDDIPNENEFTIKLAHEAKLLKVYMTHTPKDDEFMPVLAYRVDQEIVAARERLEALQRLRDKYTA